MATASVWNWNRLDYDYYETPAPSDLGGWGTLGGLGISGVQSSSQLGIDIEDALPTLPKGSRKTGTGTQAKGRIMKIQNGLGAVTPSGNTKALDYTPFIVAAGLLIAWKILK